MRIRVIDLANNFYKDDEHYDNEDDLKKAESGRELGEYCCLGYFDALEARLVEYEKNREMDIRKKVNQMVIDRLDGSCNRKNIICVTNNDQKDEDFWLQAKRAPFLFVSLIRVKKPAQGRKKIKETIEELNKQEGVIAYYTYDHSDIVALKYGQDYRKSLNKVFALHKEVQIFKMYSVFAVREDALDTCAKMNDQVVNCRLSATVKNMDKAKSYLAELKDYLSESEKSRNMQLVYFDTLGNNDLLIEISQVSIRRLLSCYKMGRLLTHTNKSYQEAFFNIESQLFGDRKEVGTPQCDTEVLGMGGEYGRVDQ